ncbi:hypothetical protein CRM22_011201 [Opisthorchis felineus]|uniref:Cadherin domain-containing protein n=2 Tax=Opisthorchiidae TaxID=6196 RepID=A0A4S2K5U7_OPIFE|nr:hypothetical protein CRM22_011201 [Opisthorchis felineus]TGZ44692.1 hypothetical protein CRM22_011201 [Opisthorchis felineus]
MTDCQGHHVNRSSKLSSLLALAFLLILWLFKAGASTHREILPWRIQERTLEFSIDENCPVGTELGTVVIPIAPHYMGPPLKYRFGSPSRLFAVDETSGQLTTAAPIDAESLCSKARQQEAGASSQSSDKQADGHMMRRHVPESEFTDQVTCSQSGAVSVHLDVNAIMSDSSLRAVHRISVRVQDLNDNGPKFSQVRWHRRLKEVLYRKGRRLDLPKASDADLLDEYSRIQYRLEPISNSTTKSSKLEIPFRLEVTPSGQPGLVLTEDLDAETNARHEFVLVAYSSAPVWNPSTSGKWSGLERGKMASQVPIPTEDRLYIEIEVADMNDNEPRFDSPSYKVSIAEDTPPGTMIYKLVAHDPDSTAQLVYSMGSSAEVAVMSATFNVESSGVVRLRSFLNFELRHTYKVPIRVNDGEFTAQSSLFVHVLDVNDEPPEFEVNPKRLVADENASVGKLIGRVRIQDPDSEAVNGKVECWEPEDLRRHQVLSFLPDPMSNPSASVYDLTTRVVLDREAFIGPQLGRLFVYLICSDGNGLPNENRPGVKHTATMTATLMVRDVNDHPPVFSQSVYHVAVRENNLLGEKIIQVKATDADEGDNAKISYSLLDRANFKVDSLTGWITANVIFDRETRDSYQVTVVANDHGKERLSSSVLLNLTILDVNDHRPHLLPCEGELPIIDRAHLQTGRIGDRNLFAIQENLSGNTFIGELLAKDDDIGLNAKLHFELAKETPLHYLTQFRLLHNGSLYTNRELDREEKEYYRLSVRVTDLSPTDPLSSTGTISIIVLDVNDNAPNFVQPSGLLRVGFDRPVVEDDSSPNILYDQPQLQNEVSSPVPLTSSNPKPTVLLSVREKPGYLITKLHAKDPDTGPNGHIRYTLAEFSDASTDFGSGSKTNPICRVTHDSGNVVLQRHLTVTDLGMHYFKVAAIDDGYPTPLKDTKILAVLVKDIPAVGSEPTNSLSSSYYSNNRTRFEFELWGFEGKSNLFIITVLASVSGLLASVLVTAIVCVSGPCSKNRSGICSRRRRQRPGQRPVTSPGCSETGNGFILGSPGQNGNGGGLGHYGFPSFHEDTFSDLPPRGVNPGSLLQEEWQLSCGRDSCPGYGNGNLMNFPHRQAHSLVGRASPAYAQYLLNAVDDPVINPQILRIDQSDTIAKNYENLGHLPNWSDIATGDDERMRDSGLGNTHTLIPNAGVYGSLISNPRSFPLGQNDVTVSTGHELFSQLPQPLTLSGVHAFCVTKPTAVAPQSFCITENPTMKIGLVTPEPGNSHFHSMNTEGSQQKSKSMKDGRTFDASHVRATNDYRKTSEAVFHPYETELQQPLQISFTKLEEQTSDSGHGGSEEDDHAQSGELRQWKTWQPIRIQCNPSNANSTYDPKQPASSCSVDPRVDRKCGLIAKEENNRQTLQRP